jgi:hypothetical protein
MRSLVALLLCLLPLSAMAQEFKYEIFANKTTPYGIKFSELGKSKGLVIEILEGALSKAGIKLSAPTREEPWARAQNEGKDRPDSLILPFARTPGREPHFKWIAVVLDENLYAYAKKGKPLPGSMDELKAYPNTVGVTLGSAPESLAKSLGLKHESVFTETLDFQHLARGSIQLILSQGYIGNYELKGLGASAAGIERSKALSDLPLWVATSLKTSDESVAKIREAVENFKKTSEYKKILSAY